jgi:hypothetical protein
MRSRRPESDEGERPLSDAALIRREPTSSGALPKTERFT